MSNYVKRFVSEGIRVPFLLMVWMLLSFSVVSCDKEETIEIVIPSGSFDLAISSFEVENGDYLEVTPTVNESKSSKGVIIKRVQYLWDEKLVGTESSAPFRLSYKIENQALGKHTLTVKILYGGDGYTDMETTEGFKYEINVVEKKAIVTAPVFSPGREIRNGEVFRCEARLDEQKTTMDVKLSKVVFLWDDIAMAELTQSPFTFEHTFTNETIGNHKLTLHYFVTGETTADNYFSYNITIKE